MHGKWVGHHPDKCMLIAANQPALGAATSNDNSTAHNDSAQSSSAADGTTYWVRDATGKMSQMPKPANAYSDKARSNALTSAVLHASSGVARPFALRLLIDSCTEIATTPFEHELVLARQLDPSTAPSLAGAVSGAPTAKQCSIGYMPLRFNERWYFIPAFYSPRNAHRLVPTRLLARAGIHFRTLDSSGMHYLHPAGSSTLIPTDPVGRVFAVPEVHTPRFQNGRLTGAPIPCTVPPDTTPFEAELRFAAAFHAPATADFSLAAADASPTEKGGDRCSKAPTDPEKGGAVATNPKKGGASEQDTTKGCYPNVSKALVPVPTEPMHKSLEMLQGLKTTTPPPKDGCLDVSKAYVAVPGSMPKSPELPKELKAKIPTPPRPPPLLIPSKTRREYSGFRRLFGVSHRRTMELARALRVELTNVADGQDDVDVEQRIANQADKAPTAVRGGDFGTVSINDNVIVTDTVGTEFPESLRGNRYAQVWRDNTNPNDGFYVTTSPDKTSATSWNSFKDFTRQAGIFVYGQCVNQPIHIRCDGGPEYRGAFADEADWAGISITRSIPYKKGSGVQYVAEGDIRVAQSRMRVNLRLADKTKAAVNIADSNVLWDLAMEHAAFQARVQTWIEQLNLNQEQVARLNPCGFGGLGTVSMQAGSPRRVRTGSKAMADRSELAMYVGTRPGGYLFLTKDHHLVYTTSVLWLKNPHQVPPSSTSTEPSSVGPESPSHTDSDPPRYSDGLGPITPGDSVSVEICDDDDNFVWYSGTASNFLSADDPSNSNATSTFDVLFDSDGVTWTLASDPGADRPRVLPASAPLVSAPATLGLSDDDAEILRHTGTIDQVEAQPRIVLSAGYQLRRPSKRQPHISIRRFTTAAGDVRPDVLTGATPLPPEPPLPHYTRKNIPPMPEKLVEALAHPIWAIHVLHSLVKEYMPHAVPTHRPATWHYTVYPAKNSLASKRLYTVVLVRFKWDGDSYKIKVRICVGASGLSQYYDFYESYVGTAPLSDLRLITALVLAFDLLSFELDFSQGYCQVRLPATPSGAPVQVYPSHGIRTFSSDRRLELLQLVMALYGLPQSGFALAQAILNKLLRQGNESTCPFDFQRSMTQPCIYRADFSDQVAAHYNVKKVIFIVWLHNDNLRTSTNVPALQSQFVAWVKSEFAITDGDVWLQLSPPSVCLGITFTYGPDWVRLNMPEYVEALVRKSGCISTKTASTPLPESFELTKLDCPRSDADYATALQQCCKLFSLADTPTFVDAHALYRSLLCSIAWTGLTVAPALACPVSLLGRVMHNPPAAAFKGLHRVVRYLIGRYDIGITYRKPRDFDVVSDFPSLEICSDASFGAPDGSAQLGYIASLQGIGPVSWQSFKSARVCLSTLMSESTAASESGREVIYKRSLLSFLGFLHPLPTLFGVDNIACVRMVASEARRFSQRTKHFRIDQQFIIECQEEGIIAMYQLPGFRNPADVMTKPSTLHMLASHAEALGDSPVVFL